MIHLYKPFKPITERGFDREMPESLKSADRYNFYNNSIHSKYFIEK